MLDLVARAVCLRLALFFFLLSPSYSCSRFAASSCRQKEMDARSRKFSQSVSSSCWMQVQFDGEKPDPATPRLLGILCVHAGKEQCC